MLSNVSCLTFRQLPRLAYHNGHMFSTFDADNDIADSLKPVLWTGLAPTGGNVECSSCEI